MSPPHEVPSRRSPVRVVVVEDSLVQRRHLVDVLQADDDILVVGEATTAVEAIALVAELQPNVVTLDLQIPEGGGQYALEHIMAHNPTPVLVLSGTVHDKTSMPAIDALVAGAMLAIPKPFSWTPALEQDLRRNVRLLRDVPVIRRTKTRPRPTAPILAPTPTAPTPLGRSGVTKVVAIGASTGGPPALATVLGGLGGLNAAVLIVQHLHADFVYGLVDWMSRVSPLPVALAAAGQVAKSGHVYIAPGGTHLRLGPGYRLELTTAPVTIHQPSANELFSSVAAHAGANGVGVLLTGMGDDGAIGLAEMHRCGARTIAQDEATCAVYGMPRAAHRLGAVDQLLPISAIASAVLRAAHSGSARS